MNPVLYILMRTDLDSLNDYPGKAVAQGSHATSLFEKRCVAIEAETFACAGICELFREWNGQSVGNGLSRGFGTTITKGAANASEIKRLVDEAERTNGVIGGVMEDPSYPVRDGSMTHLIPLVSCGYLFGDRKDLDKIAGHLPLY